MDWTLFSDPGELRAATIVGVACLMALAGFFGATPRMATLSLALTVGVMQWYPGGAGGLLDDVVSPISTLAGQVVSGHERRDSAIASATGE